jgi:hypothetical protein
MLQNPFTHLLDIIFTAEMMLVDILAPAIRLSHNMGKIPILGRKVTIDTLHAEAALVRTMNREFPTLVCGVHLVTFAAAIL